MNNVFEKIIDKLKESRCVFLSNAEMEISDKVRSYNKGRMVSYEEAIEIVQKVEEEYLPYTNVGNIGWILCKEKQPEQKGLYLITDWTGRIRVEEYLGDNMWFAGYSYVVAWRYLPEPYQQKSNIQQSNWKDAVMRTFSHAEQKKLKKKVNYTIDKYWKLYYYNFSNKKTKTKTTTLFLI